MKDSLYADTLAVVDRKEPAIVSPTTTIREALVDMQTRRVGSLLVCRAHRLVGIFTERDFLKRVLGQGRDLDAAISTVMTPKPVTAGENEAIGAVIGKMRKGGYRHLPLVDRAGQAVGQVSVREIVHYLVEHFPKVVYNLPPRPDQVQTAREGA
ncbi:MAG: CBS domain-containing protein [Dehalococcoidia bacterium]